MLQFLKTFFRRKNVVLNQKIQRKKVDSQSIINRISAQGWKIVEFPIRKSDPDPDKRIIALWKFTVFRNNTSMEVTGSTRDEAIGNLGKTLGVIPKDA